MLKQKFLKYRSLLLLLFIILIFVFLPKFLPSYYYLHLFISLSINIVLAMSFVLLLKTGLINMAIAAFMGLGAYASALLVTKSGISFWLSLPASALIVGIFALGIGFLLVRTAGFGAVILTAVIGMLVPLAIGSIGAIGGFQGIKNIPPPDAINIPFLSSIEFTSKLPYYYLILFLLLIIILIYSGFYASWTGRAWRAIGLNPNLAESLGVNVFKFRLLAFVIVCATAGLIGGYYAHYIGAITPVAFGVFKTIYVQVYAILGGLDYAFLGPATGSFLMTFFPEFMRIAKEIEPIFTGVLLILLIMFLPGGVLSLKNIGKRKKIISTVDADVNRPVQVTQPISGYRGNGEIVLQVEGLTKSFGGLVALEKVDLHVKDGEILGLIGPNGAGKTTLINVISGFHQSSAGKVTFKGQEVTGMKAPRMARLGLGRTFQASNLFMDISTLENVFTGYHMRYRTNVFKRVLRFPAARKEETDLRQKAKEILDFMGLGSLKNELARNLPHGYQRILGICMALATEPKLLLLDEPMTGMNATEVDTMMDLIRQIRNKGITIIMIEHNMDTVMNLCDRIVVLNYGQKIAEGIPAEIQENEDVIDAYLGKE